MQKVSFQNTRRRGEGGSSATLLEIEENVHGKNPQVQYESVQSQRKKKVKQSYLNVARGKKPCARCQIK